MTGVPLAAVVLAAYGCERAPSGIEAERYSVDGMRASTAVLEAEEPVEAEETTEAAVVRDVKPDSNLYNPPTHTAPTNWHVLDTRVGPKTGPGAIHRLATQWHNTMTLWWFWVPVNPPFWRGPYVGTAPAEETTTATAEGAAASETEAPGDAEKTVGS